jgi:hypothetical protein
MILIDLSHGPSAQQKFQNHFEIESLSKTMHMEKIFKTKVFNSFWNIFFFFFFFEFLFEDAFWRKPNSWKFLIILEKSK